MFVHVSPYSLLVSTSPMCLVFSCKFSPRFSPGFLHRFSPNVSPGFHQVCLLVSLCLCSCVLVLVRQYVHEQQMHNARYNMPRTQDDIK